LARAYLGSLTATLAAQRVLATAAIRSEVVKADSDTRGCSYALTFPSAQLDNVRAILSAAHINVRRYEE
jgi:hypothetical protein